MEDDLRPEYDFSTMQIVGRGPGRKVPTESAEYIDANEIYLYRAKGIPPKDSWITMSGKGTLTPSIQKAWLAKAKEFRRIRGNFLVGGFEIEYSVDLLISEVLFPGLNNLPGEEQHESNTLDQFKSLEVRREVFDRLFLKGGENLFGRKITILKNLSDELPILSGVVSKDLMERLRKIMDIRNVFAHYPVTFVQQGEELHALLIRGETPITLNQSFFEKYKKLFSSVSSELDTILQQLREKHSVVEPEETPRGWRIFIGHAELNIENWMLD